MSEGLQDLRIGFIGAGAMASALAGGLVAAGVGRDRICAGDPDAGCCKAFGEAVGAASAFASGSERRCKISRIVIAHSKYK